MLKHDAIVDMHAHFQLDANDNVVPMRTGNLKNLSAAYLAEIKQRQAGYAETSDLTRRLAEMDAAGIDYQLLSITHPINDEWRTKNPGNDFCAKANTKVAEFVARAPDRLGAFAKVDMEDIPGAITEMRRSIRELGLAGVFLITNFEVDHPEVEPFYDAAEELGIPIVLHGNLPGWIPSLYADRRLQRRPDLTDWAGHHVMGVAGSGDDWGGRYHLGSSFLFSYEESLTAMMLIVSGVLDRHPGLTVCVTHAGGTIALAAARFAAGLGLHPQRQVKTAEDFMKRLHLLWVNSDIQSERGLDFVMDVLNPDRIVLGTDFPGWGPEPLDIYSPERKLRLSQNARKMLKL